MGVTEEKISKIMDRDPNIFSKKILLALRFSDVMLQDYEDNEDKDQLFKELQAEFSSEEIVELGSFISFCVGFIPLAHFLEF
jgi:alkylhydroperoxidase family enzyme